MRKTLLALLLLTSPLACATDIWRTVLSDGTVTLSDRPINDSSELVAANVSESSLARTSAAAPSAAGGVQAALGTAGASVADNTDAAERAAQMSANCEQARSSLASLTTPNSVYVVNEDGSRQVLSDEERAEATRLAESQVERWCAGG